MKSSAISLFIITKNEAHHLEACIQSVRDLVQEIIIVDSDSTDDTVSLAQKLGTHVFEHPFENFTKQKNYALSKVTTPWALSLDADETLTPELAGEIRQAVENPAFDGYELPRTNNFLGKRMKHSGLKEEYILRLVRTSHAKFEGGKVHEKLVVSGKTAKLKNVFIHSPYDDLETYFAKLNKYTTLAAQTLDETLPRKSSIARRYPTLYALGHIFCSVPFGFIKRYILKAGFLDGMRGLIWALCSAIYTFVKYIKLWYLLQQ